MSQITGGSNNQPVGVDLQSRMLVKATSETDFLYRNRVDEGAYVWNFPEYDYDAGDTVMFLRNNSNTDLHIHHIYLYCDTASKVELHKPDNPTSAAGTEITGININLSSGQVAEAAAFQDETGQATKGPVLQTEYITANGTVSMLKEESYEIILKKNDVIAIDIATAGTATYGHIVGYYAP